MPHCWKSHATAHIILVKIANTEDTDQTALEVLLQEILLQEQSDQCRCKTFIFRNLAYERVYTTSPQSAAKITPFIMNGLPDLYQLNESNFLFQGWRYLFDLILYLPVNKFSVMSRWVFLG